MIDDNREFAHNIQSLTYDGEEGINLLLNKIGDRYAAIQLCNNLQSILEEIRSYAILIRKKSNN